MEDRELLELAAKCVYPETVETILQSGIWNPLEDDGDALRLAVKLQLDIYCHEKGAMIDGAQLDPRKPIDEQEEDPYTATRRAIVRAAAEIGKQL